MNFFNFNFTGGYRFKQKTLRLMQESYFQILKALVAFLKLPEVGNFIISGCTISGANITSGYLYIDGHLCRFEEAPGSLTSKIKKIVEIETISFKNGSDNPAILKYSAAVDSIEGALLSDFVRATEILPIPEGLVVDPAFGTVDPTLLERILELEKKNTVFQAGGGMVLWNKPAAEIPVGWAEVVDWRGRMPIGVDISDTDFNTVGEQNGSKTHTLTEAELPSLDIRGVIAGSTWDAHIVKTNGGVIEASPAAAEFSIMNPYRTVFFIEYVG